MHIEYELLIQKLNQNLQCNVLCAMHQLKVPLISKHVYNIFFGDSVLKLFLGMSTVLCRVS